MQTLCHDCHKKKSGAEATIRALMRRTRGPSGFGRIRKPEWLHTYQIVIAGLVIAGLAHHPERWIIGAAVIMGLGIWWQIDRGDSIAGEDDMFGSDARDERRRYRKGVAGLHVGFRQWYKGLKLRTRARMIWYPGSYLAGALLLPALPGLVF
jgi:hypothetical protein